ncbi:hypothetical protein FRD01_18970 [Microvenator marinus]|uniref:Uncharacterized protein n=2 Tax=Microvenator marinus TaxID=2600177 RepID=A0A5B8XWF9_9DELT|nr:hypothetical protein FRD01_18970 [Microvenator marinus]
MIWWRLMRLHLMMTKLLFLTSRLLVLLLVALPGYASAWLPVPFQVTGPQYEPRLPFGDADVNDDGYDEILVGRLLFFGRSWGADTRPVEVVSDSDLQSSNFAGDLNGDGFDDAIFVHGNGSQNAVATVYLGSPSGLHYQESLPLPVTQATIFPIGDINGDGFDDIAFSEPKLGSSPSCALADFLKVFIYSGGAEGLEDSPATVLEAERAQDCFGTWVEGGDINGDGYSDVVVLASGFRDNLDNQFQRGKVYAFFGSPDGIELTADWEARPNDQLTDFVFGFQRQISIADEDGDGFDDLLLVFGLFEKDEGSCFHYIYPGTSSGIGLPRRHLSSCGSRISWAGDIDGDGLQDRLNSGEYYPTPQTISTHLYLGVNPSESAWNTGSRDDAFPVGDVNGDAYDDFATWSSSPAGFDLRLYFGRPNPVPVADRQSVSLPQNSDVDITLSGSDPYNDLLSFRIEREPEHGRLEAFSPSLGLVRYIPNYDYFGPDSFEFAVLDPYGGVGTAEVLIEVGRLNTAPVFVPPTPSTPVIVRVGEELRLVVRAEDAEEDEVEYSATGLPWNAEFDAETGVTYWTPDQSQLGPDTWVFSASDGTDTVTRSVVLVVEEATPDPPIEQDMGSADQGIPTLPVDSGQGPNSIADQGCGCASTKGGPWMLVFVFAFSLRRRRSRSHDVYRMDA